MSDARPHVYVAHPLTSYRTEWAEECLRRLRKLLPGVDLIDPENRAWSEDLWLSEWPAVLGGLSALVAFPDKAGTIGTGCIREVTDAIFLGLPVWAFDGHRLVELTGLEFVPEPRRTARRAAVPIGGRRLKPAVLLARLSEAAVVPYQIGTGNP